ncbi:hypothetical protein DMA15_26525 [Streptomyces sp. WAC 01529]|uniref:hypothetical protein n=1 Tax=Streptomyces sp. WAC 01529 TaxID=2203205 RepID=UPI000F7097A2|nr:hypothetical protein [Streptomyces sp. WAC 01529]AZM55703.1 hypothetical protein DMA15_26525 [Streptomyces sp. WAC 01529]
MRFKLLGPAVTSAALVATAFTGGVAVAESPSAPKTAAAAAHDCGNGFSNVPAKESVKIRSTPRVNGTALGLWPKGKRGDLCDMAKKWSGDSYRLCGKSSNKWYYGVYGNTRGFVPVTCINFS